MLESTSAQSFRVYFMLVDGSGAIQGSFATWGATYKLTAPAPPDHVSLGIGNQKLLAAFSYEQVSDDLTINGYQLYCEPDGAADGDAAHPRAPPRHGSSLAQARTPFKIVGGRRRSS